MLVLTVKLGDRVQIGDKILTVESRISLGMDGIEVKFMGHRYFLIANEPCLLDAYTEVMYKRSSKGKIRLSFNSPHKILRESLLKEET